MGMGVRVKVWGNYALFSRPELKVRLRKNTQQLRRIGKS